jgi:hypothetical protein
LVAAAERVPSSVVRECSLPSNAAGTRHRRIACSLTMWRTDPGRAEAKILQRGVAKIFLAA